VAAGRKAKNGSSLKIATFALAAGQITTNQSPRPVRNDKSLLRDPA